jgi:hypothetical protein
MICHGWHREGSAGIGLLMLELSARWRWVTSAMFRSLYPLERVPVPTLVRLTGTQGQFGRIWQYLLILCVSCILQTFATYNQQMYDIFNA